MKPATTRDRGAIIPLTALLLTVIILCVAFAVDLGRQRSERRDMQAIADVVSLDLARTIEGRDAAAIDLDLEWSAAILRASTRNDHAAPTIPCPTGDIVGRCLTVTVGNVPDPTTQAFVPCPPVGAPNRATCFPDAVEVVAGTDVDYSFQPGSGDTRRSAVAQVGDNAQARFQVGSSLLATTPGTNSIIGQLLNTIAPGFSVLSYEGLVNADVTLADLGVPLGIPLTTASPQELLDTTVGLDQLALASLQALQSSGGDPAAISILQGLIAAGVSDAQVSLGEVLGVNAPGGAAGATADVNVAQMLLAGVFLADDEHFVSVPGTTLAIPGIGDVGVRLTGIEAPQEGGNGEGASVTTRQIGLELTPTFNINTATVGQNICALPPSEQNLINSLLGGVLNLLGCTLAIILPPPLQPLSIQVQGTVPITASVAEVTVSQSIDCANEQLTLTPSPATVDLDADINLNISATLAGVQIPNIARLSVSAGAYSPGTASPQTFTGENGVSLPTGIRFEEFDPPSAPFGSTPLGLSQVLQANAGSLSVLNLNLAGLGNRVLSIIQPVINLALGQLDTLLLQPLAQLLGINLGGGDLTPLWMQCDESAVQLVG